MILWFYGVLVYFQLKDRCHWRWSLCERLSDSMRFKVILCDGYISQEDSRWKIPMIFRWTGDICDCEDSIIFPDEVCMFMGSLCGCMRWCVLFEGYVYCVCLDRWLYVMWVCLCYFQRRCMSGEGRCGGVCMGLVYGRKWLYVCYLKVVCYCISPLVVIEDVSRIEGARFIVEGESMYVSMNLCIFEVNLCYIWRFYVIFVLFWCYMNVIFFVIFLWFFRDFFVIFSWFFRDF